MVILRIPDNIGRIDILVYDIMLMDLSHNIGDSVKHGSILMISIRPVIAKQNNRLTLIFNFNPLLTQLSRLFCIYWLKFRTGRNSKKLDFLRQI